MTLIASGCALAMTLIASGCALAMTLIASGYAHRNDGTRNDKGD
jgi:hypothetical protein